MSVTGYIKPDWEFLPETYGALGDGKTCAVNTTASSTTVVATSAVFTDTATDGGKQIMIHGANGATSAPLLTTISSVTDSTHAVLASAPSSSRSACPAVFATDDQPAFDAALSALGSYATSSGSYYGRLLLDNKIYGLKTLTQTGNGTSTPTFNTHLPIPYPTATGTSPKLVVEIASPRDNGYCQYWESTIPNVGGGSLVSFTSTGTSEHATFGRQSVIGGPTGGAGFTGSFANTKVVIRNVSVWLPIWTNVYAYDLRWISAARAERSGANIFAPPGANGAAVTPYLQSIGASSFLTSVGTGWAFPVTGNNADVTADDLNAEGYEVAYRVWDHFTAGRLSAIYSDVVMVFDSTVGLSGTSHGLFVQNMTAEIYNGGLLSEGGTAQVVMNWDAECSGPSYDFSDSGDHFYGQIRFRDPAGARTPVKVGGANLTIVTDGP